MLSTFLIKDDNNCHASLIVKPEHNQSPELFKKNNIRLLNEFANNFVLDDVFVCTDNQIISFNKSVCNQNSTLLNFDTTSLELKIDKLREKFIGN